MKTIVMIKKILFYLCTLLLLVSCMHEKTGEYSGYLQSTEVELKSERQTCFYLLSLVLIIGLTVIILFLIWKGYQTKLLHIIEILRKKDVTINDYACKVTELESTGVQERKANKEEIGGLNRKILCLTTENKRMRENSCVEALFILEELKQGKLIVSKMTASERQHLFDFLDLVHADFITRLSKEFELTKNELLLAALLRVGFSNKQLMIVLDCEMKSVYKSRQRLKVDLGLGKEDSLEQMIMMY